MALSERLFLPIKTLSSKWRTSLTFRVLFSTVLLALFVAFAVSSIALTQVRDGLVVDRTESAVQKARDGLFVAQQVVNSFPFAESSSDRSAMVDAVLTAVAAPGGSLGDYEVLLLAASDVSLVGRPERGTNDISDETITEAIRTRITNDQAMVWQIGELVYLDGTSQPGVIVGAPIQLPGAGDYELYQVFPFEQQVQMLGLTRQAVFIAAVFMIFAIIGIALLLTNQVVRPIRSAAESAQRLKAGRLTERIAIKGQDDLAVLASSFNSMAAGMQEQIRRLESLSRVQQRFVSDVSHELRTPLTTIRMASELLYATKTDFDPASERAVELLQQQSERFEILLNDLLEISRIDAGSAKIEAADLYFESILNKVIEDLSPVLRDNQLEVRVHEVGLKEKVITADFRRVERIVRNLVSNAIEHAEGKPIDLVAFHDENVLVFCARDYGVGLEPGQAALVFNRFWRADPSRQRTLGGTGLGLSISMEDARLHGGWLEADGALGQGANFRFVLPLSIGNNIGAVAVPLVIDQFDEWLESNS